MEAAYKRGQPPPSFIADAPTLLPGLDLYLEAFRELSTCRPYIGMNGAPGPIPWDRINDWGREHEFDGEAREYLVVMIRALDDEYLEWMGEEGGKPGTVQPQNGKPGRTDSPGG